MCIIYTYLYLYKIYKYKGQIILFLTYRIKHFINTKYKENKNTWNQKTNTGLISFVYIIYSY